MDIKNSILTSIPVPNYQGTNLLIDLKKHTEAVKELGLWKAPDNSQKKQVTIIIDNEKYWYKRIASRAIPRHLV